ncbi:hypothetical protein MNBD_ALPHA05-1607 [hydrothermal vent metagenome]|uniref:Uncharacterized protein n=1 Tax=hydrothermal vent metagenome TaxID=652676 RepID=A0A3B0S2U9_9ZZZZ
MYSPISIVRQTISALQQECNIDYLQVNTRNSGSDRAEKRFFCALVFMGVVKRQQILILNWLALHRPGKLAHFGLVN